jgi:hypothetical protein
MLVESELASQWVLKMKVCSYVLDMQKREVLIEGLVSGGGNEPEDLLDTIFHKVADMVQARLITGDDIGNYIEFQRRIVRFTSSLQARPVADSIYDIHIVEALGSVLGDQWHITNDWTTAPTEGRHVGSFTIKLRSARK